MKRKKRSPVNLVIFGFAVFCIISVVIATHDNQNTKVPASKDVAPATKVNTSTKLSSSKQSVSRPAYKPFSQSQRISFPKGFISLRDVEKHPKLHNESEVAAYFYRYNQSAAGYHYRKPKMASENLQNFKRYKRVLGEKRYYEIMNLADSDYPFK